jgi:hypothetical protein
MPLINKSHPMKNFIYAFLFSLFAGTTSAAISPQTVDPALTIVSIGHQSRILVYSVCSPEHCWSDSYLQRLPDEANPTSIICTARIKEISVGHLVNHISSSVVDGAWKFELDVSASHGGFDPHSVTVTPLDGCNYTFTDSATHENL